MGAIVARGTMAGWMPEPVIIPRADHPISRRDIDPDALEGSLSAAAIQLHRVPRRRQRARPAAPAPAEGLRRRHRRASLSDQEAVPKLLDHRPPLSTGARALRHQSHRSGDVPPSRAARHRERAGNRAEEVADEASAADLQIRHDNTFGTPEEDAFRRDFTINALFYDIATFSIIDYVGGLDDLRDGVIRSIGDPAQRFQEDPVRMFRAVAFAARLGFTLDPPVVEGIRQQRAPDRERVAGAPDRGVLQGAAVRRGREDVPPAGRSTACSRPSRRSCTAARRKRRSGRRSASWIAIASDSSRCPTD